jgi:uncharacterized protein
MPEPYSSLPTLWKWNNNPGHESCRVVPLENGWQVIGAAVFKYLGLTCQLRYDIRCDSQWVTRAVMVTGWADAREIVIEIGRSDSGEWQMNGRTVDTVKGCIDIDLNFSPSTNLLPIRRLNLPIGQTARVQAAWLKFPEFRLEPLEQSYTRLEERTYRYESSGGAFTATLTVDDNGLVMDYAEWSRITS